MDTLAVVVVAAALVLSVVFVLRRKRLRLPPGPKGHFLLGNLKDVSRQYQWLVYAGFAKKFGDIITLRALGHTFVVLNAARDVREVLVKRGRFCAARMRYVMYEHAGWENDVHLVDPDGLRVMKRFATRSLNPNSIPQFADAADKEIAACLKRLLKHSEPFDPEADIKWLAGGVILRIAYGYEVTSYNDKFIALSDAALHTVFDLTSPGWIIDTVPWLRYLPDWMFGPRFVQTVTNSRELVRSVRSKPIEWTQQQLAAGTTQSSLAAELLSLPDHKDNDILFVLLADLYAAGMDTTLAMSLKLLMTLALYPDVQAKAQREVDGLTNGERLPTYSDHPRLPCCPGQRTLPLPRRREYGIPASCYPGHRIQRLYHSQRCNPLCEYLASASSGSFTCREHVTSSIGPYSMIRRSILIRSRSSLKDFSDKKTAYRMPIPTRKL